ncbi:Rpn family recombination-promoting nuclease/putative transposase [Sphingobacterium sp. UT-1RO-CII-1]|uniref:Rpn family recombination-promoting nuclease/putative transposase n=1 Tax=Sphingobacterium sp. UT-1RO-CII-1 TaxID=2995225 RepID=UPI00227B086A|nr:Rpn family recombination-promoting nuclease/putative transposase [Sphingobacterium sp. UT-1RO-CII-1]MCY4778584.1 Rpn family recombination-promoting nuclease/putative transposase [Sphingobacterium sp. UT-1RO-CII-1]
MATSKKHLGKYVDPRTDFGIKFYFGREENKILLIEFLNSLFEGEKVIVDLKYKTVEHDGDQEDMRRVVFDLHCIGSDGEIFIVEFQQLFQEFFKDRAVFYTSRLINKQLAKGKKGNDYHLPEVYFVGILEFDMNGGSNVALSRETDRPYFYDVALCDKHTHEVFYDKLGYKMVSLPVFNKQPKELETIMDQWLYLLKHLSTMDKLPSFLDKRIFGRIFAIGEIGKLKEEDLMSYEASLKQRRDAESVFNSALRSGHAKGKAEGRAEGRAEGLAEGLAEGEHKKAIESATKMLKNGFEVKMISEILGLTIEEVEKLK